MDIYVNTWLNSTNIRSSAPTIPQTNLLVGQLQDFFLLHYLHDSSKQIN